MSIRRPTALVAAAVILATSGVAGMDVTALPASAEPIDNIATEGSFVGTGDQVARAQGA